MTDLVRQRVRPSGPGMTAPIGVEDGLVRRLLEELQERVAMLSVSAPSTLTGAAEISTVRAELDIIHRRVNEQTRKLSDALDRITVMETSVERAGFCRMVNDSGEDIPYHSFGQISGVTGDGKSLVVVLPADADKSSALIPYPVSAGKPGYCLRFAPWDVRVAVLSGETLAAGDYIDMVVGQWTGGKNAAGRWRVTEVYSGATGPGEAACAVVYEGDSLPPLVKIQGAPVGDVVSIKYATSDGTEVGAAFSVAVVPEVGA